MQFLSEDNIEQIAIGAAVLGTGGGGDPYIGKLMAKRAIQQYGPVKVLTLDDVKDDDLIVPVSMIGAPSVMAEKIPSEEQIIKCLDAMENTIQKKASAVMPIEVGGVNSLIPIIAAARKGIPVVNADAMGRAFPEAHMVTFYLDGHKPDPITLADERGNVISANPANGPWSEKIARALTVEMGGSASMCDYALEGKVIKQSAIPDTLSLAASIGEILLKKYEGEETALQALLEKLQGYMLITGKLSMIHRKVDGGFTKGTAEIIGMDNDKNRKITLHFQNEQLLVTEGENPLAITPDLISVLDKETGLPITTEQLKYGARVTVIAYPCHEKWRSVKGIEVAGPSYFGYTTAYRTVEELQQSEVQL